jgi:hypothetical protein
MMVRKIAGGNATCEASIAVGVLVMSAMEPLIVSVLQI